MILGDAWTVDDPVDELETCAGLAVVARQRAERRRGATERRRGATERAIRREACIGKKRRENKGVCCGGMFKER